MNLRLALLAAILVGTSPLGADPAHESPAAPSPRKLIPLPPYFVPTPPTPAEKPPDKPLSDAAVTWDADQKNVTVPAGTAEAHLSFVLTNVSSGNVRLLSARGSCGCTVAKLPQPSTVAPLAQATIAVTMNLGGKFGTVEKTVTVNTDEGIKVLHVIVTILPAPGRETMQQAAAADRQAVFKGDCAACHADPARNKQGKVLFTAACGVCHEAEHRATMVPDLFALAHSNTAETWRQWIAHGKPGTLMPAFAKSEGGILTDAQIDSVAAYLTAATSPRPSPR